MSMRKKYFCDKKRDPVDDGSYTLSDIKRLLSKSELVKFNKWIDGQTCPILSTGEIGFYKHDVNRFIGLIRYGKPTYWD